MYCPKCGQPNIDAAKFCSSCGSVLNLAAPNTMPILPAFNQAVADPDAAYRVFIGLNNQQYYLNYFQQFDRAGQTSTSWHWPAFFVTWYWLLYRKMWLIALIYFLLPYVIGLIGGVMSAISSGLGVFISGVLWVAYLFAIFVWFPMNANALYYKHCQKKIQEVKATTGSPDVQLGLLAGRGGTSGIVMILVLVFAFISIIGILAAISVPAYQDYTMRAKVAQALAVGSQAEVAVTQYYQQQNKPPTTLVEAGFTAKLPPYIESMEMDSRADGTITIIMGGASMQIQDKKIYLVPSLEANNSLSWKCSSPDIKDRLMPQSCRQQ